MKNFGRGPNWGRYNLSWGKSLWTPLDIASLVGWWSLAEVDEIPANTQQDKSSNSDDGTIVNAPAYIADNFSRVANAMDFNGVNEYITFTGTTFTGQFSISVRVWSTSGVAENKLLGGYGGTNDLIRVDSATNKVSIRLAGVQQAFLFPSVAEETWYTLVLTRDASNNVRVYLDTVESTTGAVVMAGNFTMSSIGRTVSSWNFDGRSCSLTIFNAEISTDDITNLHTKRY